MNENLPKKSKNPGSPKFNFTPNILDTISRLTKIGTPLEEVAWFIGCNKKTIERQAAVEDSLVSVALLKGRNEMKDFLRENAFQMAKKNPGMAISLCKVKLGWKEKSEIEVSNPEGKAIQIQLADKDRKAIEQMARAFFRAKAGTNRR